MSEIFTNKIGTEIFARNLFSFNEEIPHDRFVDPEYQRLSKRSLLKDGVEWLSVEPPCYKITAWGRFKDEN